MGPAGWIALGVVLAAPWVVGLFARWYRRRQPREEADAAVSFFGAVLDFLAALVPWQSDR
jgi:hypothetical protein